MDLFWKCMAGVLIAAVLVLTLDKGSMGLLLSVTVCAMLGTAAMSYLTPVKEFLEELQSLAHFQDGLLEILLKAVGIALTAELAGTICQDCGLSALAKTVHFLANCLILLLSIPVFQSLLTVLKDILNTL